MKGLTPLLRISLINTWSSLKENMINPKRGKLSILYAVLIALAFIGVGTVAGFVIFGEVMLYQLLERMGQPLLLPAVVLMLCMILTLVMSFMQTFSRLYLSKDAAWLASLPLTSRQVMSARLVEVYLWELLTNLVLLAPALVMLGLHLKDWSYWIRAAAVFVCFAGLPVAVTTLLSSLLAKVSRLTRNKELMVTLGSLLMVSLVLGLEFTILPHIPEDAGAMFFVSLIINQSGLINLVTSSFPPLKWAVDGLAGNWVSCGLFVGASIGALALVVVLMGGRYLHDCISHMEQSASRKAYKGENAGRGNQSQLMALFQREWREILRSPTYAMNSLMSIVFVPLMTAFMVLGMSTEIPVEEIVAYVQRFLHMISEADLILLSAAIMGFGCMINPAVSTAVSREGKHHDLYRMMPLEPGVAMKAKLMMGMSINAMASATAAIMCAVVFGAQAFWVLPGFALASMLNFAVSAVSLAADAINPNYTWSNETQVIKQSMSVMWGMLAGMLFLLLPVGAWALVRFKIEAGAWTSMAAVAGVLVVEVVVGWLMLFRMGTARYAASEC